MRVVVGLGGHALGGGGDGLDVRTDLSEVKAVAAALAPLVEGNQLVVTHGNGPHTLPTSRRAGRDELGQYPIDVLGAENEGLLGYLLDRELANELPGARVAGLLTQVVVDPGDPAFARPDLAIGPVYEEPAARVLAARLGWFMDVDDGGFRRFVATPEPQHIMELDVIRILAEAGVVVVCAGGGGIPVIVEGQGGVRGIEAVVNKDLAAALLAVELAADRLVLLTDVPAVVADWGTPAARPIRRVHPRALRSLQLPPHTMGAKAEAACRFVEQTGRSAHIGSYLEAMAVLEGRAGTTVDDHDRGLASG